jgi:hypothetical protein
MFSYFWVWKWEVWCRIVQQEARTNCSMFVTLDGVVGKGQKRASR